MWVRFTGNYSWKPNANSTIDYQAGATENVTTECGEAAIAKGVAEKVPAPRKNEKAE
jgi:hypothetical protein